MKACQGWIARLGGCFVGALMAGSGFAADGLSARSPAPGLDGGAHVKGQTTLASHYARIQSALVSRGLLRQDRAQNVPMTAAALEESFYEIALQHEYGRSSAGKPLLRWEDPVRYAVAFGASITDSQRRADTSAIGQYFRRLSGVTGHPIAAGTSPNFLVLVVNDGERRGMGAYLRSNVPGISNASINAILRMPTNHFCMVVTVPHANRANGIQSAVAVIRAEHSGRMRTSCIHEELAQGMGLPNDCRNARPSIFNDDEEFGVLTAHDEHLLRILYSPSLRSGMRREDARPIVQSLTQQLALR
ncbi:MAG: DUF2927 domain-containing protein [Pseudomonadota bacterium]